MKNKGFSLPKRDWLIAIFWLSPVVITLAQANTEAMRIEGLSPGFHFDLGGNFGYTDGNSSLFQNRSNLRLDYVQDRGHTFLVANYRLNTKDRLRFIDKAFAHLRFVRPLQPALSGELFLQKEFNKFIQLQDRQLAGLGMRIKWHEIERFQSRFNNLQLTTGIGFMGERERIDVGIDGNQGDPIHGSLAALLRSTNYIVLSWTPNESLGILATTYFQFDTRRIEDYRVLVQSLVEVSVTRRLALTVEMNLRYDSEPPGDIKALDIDLTNGFAYTF